MKLGVAILFLFTLVSCDYFISQQQEEVVARVNNTYLYKADIEGLINPSATKEDSILLVENFINQWATKQLLIDKASINIPQDQLEQYDKLVNDYRNSLLTEAYKNILVSRAFDSVVNESALSSLYERDKDNFLLNDQLVKVRYIHIDQSNTNIVGVKDKLNRFSNKDREDLVTMSLEFKDFNFNDSTWIKKEVLLENLKILKEKPNAISKNQLTKIEDSTGVYFIYVNDILNKNDVAPLSYIKPTIKQIVLNKRKLELIKKIEQDITRDARANNDFEVFIQN